MSIFSKTTAAVSARRHPVVWFVMIVWLICPSAAGAQAQGNFRHYDRSDGLSSEVILSISQDTLGFLWIGTTNGLNRFDGVRFRTFDSDPQDSSSLPNTRVNTVFESKKGDLWLGSHNGLVRYSSKTDDFERIQLTDSIRQIVVHGIAETPDADLWISTWQEGLFRIRPETGDNEWVLQDLEVSTADGVISGSRTVRTVFVQPNGMLLLAGYRGIFEYDPASKTLGEPPFSVQTNRALRTQVVFSISQDSRSDYWLSSFEGVLRIDANTGALKKYSDAKDGGWNIVRKVFVDSQGSVWAGSDNGLMKYDAAKDRFEKIVHSPTDPGSSLKGSVNEIYEDNSGVLWVGSSERGMSSLDLYESPVPTVIYDPINPKRFPNGHVWDAMQLSDGNVLLATTAGLKRWIVDQNRFEDLGRSTLGTEGIQTLFKDSRGRVWVAPRGGGLCNFDLVLERCLWVSPDELSPGSINTIVEGSDSRLWLGMSSGLFSINGNSLTADLPGYRPAEERERIESFVLSTTEDSNGFVWVGSERGLFLKKPDESQLVMVQLLDGNGMIEPTEAVIDLEEDADGQVWILDKHVHVWRPTTNTFDIWNHQLPELQFRTPLGMTMDREGVAWIHYEGALVAINDSLELVHMFSGLSGKTSLQSWSGASRTLASGRMVFGFGSGVYDVEPRRIRRNQFRPAMLFSDLRIANSIIRPSKKGRLSSSFATAQQLVLHHDDLAIDISFSSSRFGKPEENIFLYRVEGLNSEWTETKTPAISFSSLNPGDYLLRVKTFGPNGLVSNEKTMSIVVLPPWWKTIWFRLVLAAGMVFVVALAYRQRVRAIVSANQHLESVVAERTRLLDQQSQQLENQAQRLIDADQSKSRFFSNVSHELKTPLTLIRGYLEELSQSAADKFSDRESKRIERSLSLTENLDRLVLQLLELARADANKLQLNAHRGELGRFVHKIVSEFSGSAEKNGIQLILEQEEGTIWLEYDAVKLHQIISNLVSNALKFSKEKGSVWVSVTTEKTANISMAVVEVADTGPGIPAPLLDKIFDRFFQVDDPSVKTSDGFGIGLSLAHDFAELHGGALEVVSDEGAGTVFTLKLPIQNTDTVDSAENDPVHVARYVDIVQADQVQTEKKGRVDKSTILVVEDNPELLEYLDDLLSEDFIVVKAEHGAEAWEMVQAGPYDLVLSDVMMPVMDGMVLLNNIKTHKTLWQIPVVLLTARGGDEEQLEGLQAQANDYIAKPFNSKILKARLLNLIEESSKRNVQPASLPSEALTNEDSDFLKRLNAFVLEHISEFDLQNQDIAQGVFVSERTLQRKVKDLTGQSAAVYVRQVRIAQARKHLDGKTILSVSRVSRAVGFQNVSYFSKLFLEEYGVEPSAYLD